MAGCSGTATEWCSDMKKKLPPLVRDRRDLSLRIKLKTLQELHHRVWLESLKAQGDSDEALKKLSELLTRQERVSTRMLIAHLGLSFYRWNWSSCPQHKYGNLQYSEWWLARWGWSRKGVRVVKPDTPNYKDWVSRRVR